jgi:hypothetical protein
MPHAICNSNGSGELTLSQKKRNFGHCVGALDSYIATMLGNVERGGAYREEGGGGAAGGT